MRSCKTKLKKDSEKYFSLLKLLPKTTIDSNFDETCEFCQCECCFLSGSVQSIKCNSKNSRDRNTNINRKKKNKKSKRSKSASDSYFYRDCSILKDFYEEISKTPPPLPPVAPRQISPPLTHNIPFDSWPNAYTNEIQLCESMQNLCLSPKVRKAYRKIPLHDQKILNCMARSRSEKATLNENAWLAQKFWENEKYERELLKCEQKIEYKQAIREKQNYDYQMTKDRIDALTKRDLNELKRLRETLCEKDIRLADRLKHIKLDKSIMQCQRQQDEYRKIEAVQIMQEEQDCDDKLRQHEIYNRLENRLSRADYIRQQYLNAYTKRLRYDNYMEQILHDEHFKETEKFENFKKAQLQQKISNKSCRTKQFIEHRRRNFNQLVERAKLSATLRDLVRRSVSPDGFQFYSAGAARTMSRQNKFFDRPISNLSFQSCLHLK